MNMQNLNRYIPFISITSEITHLFCCALPLAFSFLNLLTSFGLLTSMPSSLDYFHNVMHNYEIPLIIFSAVLLTLGWVLHLFSQRIDCREDGHCSHQPCAPIKKRSSRILLIATGLFIFNLTAYFVFHY